MSTPLPVAARVQVRRAALGEIGADKGAFAAVLVVNGLAAGAGLIGPRLLGRIVDTVRAAHGRAAVATVDHLTLVIAAATVAQIVLTRYALHLAARFGERTAARIRERFLERALALPAATVEHTAVGDLTARGTTDVGAVAAILRDAVPEVFIAVLKVLFVIGAVLLVDPLLGLSGFLCLAVVVAALRWYLRRARAAYLAEGAAGSQVAEVLTSTASGARTVEALGLQQRRLKAAETAIAESRRTRLATLALRTGLFPTVQFSYVLPVVTVLLAGGLLHRHGVLSLGAVVACAVYLGQLVGPLDTVLLWSDDLQSSGASYARVEGLATAPRTAHEPGHAAGTAHAPADTTAREGTPRLTVTDVHYAYPHRPDVLHGVSLDVRPGERLAVVGPSGAGKTTLGRLLAGIDRPRTGSVTAGTTPLADLPPDRLRREVVLVTQEHHVFHDSLRDNLLIARPDATDAQLRAALRAVGAHWADELPDGLGTLLGGGAHRPDGARAQQIALARVVLADPHTIVLDEATALLDPTTARSTERALSAVLGGRTVIAIAHRLQTARDADRVAVMVDGVVAELGSHDELVASGGVYARLWRSWHA